MAWRRDSPDDAQTSFHGSERLRVGETQLKGIALAGAELQRIVRGHFCPRLVRVDGGFVAANQVLVKRVLHIRRTVPAVEKPGNVSLVFGEEQLRLACAEKPAFAVLPMFNLGAQASGNAGGFLHAGSTQIPAPGPRVAKPQRRQDMQA